MQSNALRNENAALREQMQEHCKHAAALQEQTAEQSRTIHLGNMQLEQLQSKVGAWPYLYWNLVTCFL